jgi:riboflavin transporter FmnP
MLIALLARLSLVVPPLTLALLPRTYFIKVSLFHRTRLTFY